MTQQVRTNTQSLATKKCPSQVYFPQPQTVISSFPSIFVTLRCPRNSPALESICDARHAHRAIAPRAPLRWHPICPGKWHMTSPPSKTVLMVVMDKTKMWQGSLSKRNDECSVGAGGYWYGLFDSPYSWSILWRCHAVLLLDSRMTHHVVAIPTQCPTIHHDSATKAAWADTGLASCKRRRARSNETLEPRAGGWKPKGLTTEILKRQSESKKH